MHQALYRKWRPSVFSDVVGQEHITGVLSYEAKEGKLNHAYLFCGSRGTGKTTCAKILAKAANCKNLVNGNPCNECESCRSIDLGTSIDVLEMDAASNTGVDYIRDIRDEVIYTPSEMGTRVYIIDEVHMLSEGAFNALLKTLEEPPPKVIFILATTELQKIPATILSRCQRFDFKRISVDAIISRLMYIADNEGIDLTPDGARLIARLAQGGMRDSISMLELCAADGETITDEKVLKIAGVVGREEVVKVVRAIKQKNPREIFDEISSIHKSSRDLSVFISDLMQYYRDMMIQKTLNVKDMHTVSNDILDVSENELADLIELASSFKYSTLIYHSKLLEGAYLSMSKGADKRITAEMTLVRMCSDSYSDSNDALSARIDALEDRLTQVVAGTVIQPQKTKNESEDKDEKSSKVVEKEINVQNTVHDFFGWAELVSKYEKVDKGGAAFLRDAQALYDDRGVLYVKIGDSFAKMLLESSGAAGALRSLAAADGDDFTDVIFEVGTKKNTSKDIFDDLL